MDQFFEPLATAIGYSVVFLVIFLPLSWVLARFIPLGDGPSQQAASAIGICILVLVAKSLDNESDPAVIDFAVWELPFCAPGAFVSWLILRWLLRKSANQID